jgi:two-component system response regulator LytT
MNLTALIIDDEQLAREELQFLLDSVGGVDVVAQGTNGIEGVELIGEHRPDLVFLDVQMPGLDGFAVIQKVMERNRQQGASAGPLPQIIFATAYDQYAVRAFDVNAVDYLLKPFDQARVEQAVARARNRIEMGGAGANGVGVT